MVQSNQATSEPDRELPAAYQAQRETSWTAACMNGRNTPKL